LFVGQLKYGPKGAHNNKMKNAIFSIGSVGEEIQRLRNIGILEQVCCLRPTYLLSPEEILFINIGTKTFVTTVPAS
jgi:hypothetical protein